MKIKGRYETYTVKWIVWGWTYTRVEIYGKRKTLFGLITYNKFLYQTKGTENGCAKRTWLAEEMFPQEMKKWFEFAVKEYEDKLDKLGNYEEEWRKFNKENSKL